MPLQGGDRLLVLSKPSSLVLEGQGPGDECHGWEQGPGEGTLQPLLPAVSCRGPLRLAHFYLCFLPFSASFSSPPPVGMWADHCSNF